MSELAKKAGNIVTFYSYKGGVGRSMALANIAVLLANWGYKTLIIDWDLEAPGLENFFKNYIEIPKAKSRPGLIDILNDEIKLSPVKIKWTECLIDINIGETSSGINIKNKLHLLTSGNYDSEYNSRVRDFDFNTFYTEHDGGNVIEKLRNQWKDAYDFVLIDSRTGVTDIGGVCTIQLPDLLVLLFTPTDQGFNGIRTVAAKASAGRKQLPFDRFQLSCLPVPTRIDGTESGPSAEWFRKFEKGLDDIYSFWLNKSVNRLDFLLKTKVPYSSFYSFGEGLPVVDEGTKDPQKMGYAYEPLAALVATQLNRAELLITNRDDFVLSAANTEIDLDTLEVKQAYQTAKEVVRNRENQLEKSLAYIQEERGRQRKRNYIIIAVSVAILFGAVFAIISSIHIGQGEKNAIARHLKDSLLQARRRDSLAGTYQSKKLDSALKNTLPSRFASITSAGKPIGIDVSRLNGMDEWNKIKNSGISFIFFKATDGSDYQDRTFSDNWTKAKANGLIRGAYLYYSTKSAPASQAKNFIGTVKLDSGDMPPVLDLATLTGLAYNDYAANKLYTDIGTITSALRAHYHVLPIIFCTYDIAKVLAKNDDMRNYPLWIGLYGDNNKPNPATILSVPYLPDASMDWVFWQFTTEGTLDGISNKGANVDLNQFNGTYEQLKAFLIK